MKHVNFLMVAVMVLLSTVATSCMKGDPTVSGTFVMKVTRTYPYSFKFSNSDIQYVATNTDALMISNPNLNTGDIVMINWSYNSDEQPIDANTTRINVLVSGVRSITGETPFPGTDTGESWQNATINFIGESEYNKENAFSYFDKNTLIIPTIFLFEEATVESSKKHDLKLYYDESQTESDDTEIVFYLRHRSSEEKATYPALLYTAFDISYALRSFEGTTGSMPRSVKIMAAETQNQNSNKLEDAKSQLTPYVMGYNFKD